MGKHVWSLDDLLKATGGELISGNRQTAEFSGISTDSRKIEKGNVFVALVGERFDGHDFLMEVLEKGAECLIVDKLPNSFDATAVAIHASSLKTFPSIIKVPNTLKALGDLAHYRRSSFTGPVVGVTGSNGKTSTKEMITTILDGSFQVLKNPLNWNNNVGVPLSLLRLEDYHTAVVIEMGINHPGEMDELVAIAEPTIGVITNIQKAHLEGLGSEEQICAEKTKLWHALPKGKGCAIVNLDDPWLSKASKDLADIAIVSFGFRKDANVTVDGGVHCSRNGTSFIAKSGSNRAEVNLSVLGEHFALNALSALAVGIHLGIPLETGAERLSRWKPVAHRMECLILPDGSVIVDDTYNANPGSMIRAIETVAKMAYAESKPFIAIIGDMKELGASSEELHRLVGRTLAEKKPTGIFTLGDFAKFIAEEGRKAGVPMVIEAANHADLLESLTEHWIPGAWLLVKGSRSMRMEQIVEGLIADAET